VHVFDTFWSDDAEKALMHGPTYMACAGLCRGQRLARLFERERGCNRSPTSAPDGRRTGAVPGFTA